MENLLKRHFHLIFVGLFFTVSGFLLPTFPLPKPWDEDTYLRLAAYALANPLSPFHPDLSWLPHPPLLWYLLAVFYPVPRLASLLTSAICICFLFWTCKRLYGNEVANLSAAVLVSSGSYLLFSLVTFPDGPVTNFMALVAVSFLCWSKLGDGKFLGLSGLGLALASLTDYTAVPILAVTFLVWMIILRKNFNWLKFLKFAGVTTVSLLPVTLWICSLSQFYGNIAQHYFSIYKIFSSDDMLLRLAVNLLCFGPYPFLMGGLPLIAWIRRPSLDLDSKLLLVYSAIIFIFFLIITPLYARAYPPYNRYLLPMIPALTIISARSLAKEKESIRFLILCLQFVFASLFSWLTLLSLI